MVKRCTTTTTGELTEPGLQTLSRLLKKSTALLSSSCHNER